jgi:glycerol-3-phosphate dehydrogenase
VQFLKIDAKSCETANVPLVEDAKFSAIVPPPVSQEAVIHFCRNEWAIHLDDIMIRRTSWRHYHRDHESIAQQVAIWMSDALRWTSQQMQSQLENYRAQTGTAHA